MFGGRQSELEGVAVMASKQSTCQTRDEDPSGSINPHLILNVVLNRGAAKMRGCQVFSSHFTSLSEILFQVPKANA